MNTKYHLYQSANSFFKNSEKYTVENLLSDNYLFDNFVHDLSGLNLDNASGRAFREVFLGFYKDGVPVIRIQY